MIDGSMSPDVLQSAVAWLRRNPSHPGEHLADMLEGQSPMTVDLALRLEAAAWDPAEGWMRWQVDYDAA